MKGEKNPPQHLVVCRRCGHMWEPNTGSRRPQCTLCKSTSKRHADKAEIAAYQRGERRSLHVDDGADNADDSVESGADNAESDADAGVEYAESESDAGDIHVEKVDIEALLGDATGHESHPARMCGLKLVGTIVALVAVGSLVGWFLVSLRNRQHTQRGRENVDTVADKLPEERRRYVMPGARATLGW